MSLKHLTPDDVFPLLHHPDVLLIDIRNDHELTTGVLPGALHVPLQMLSASLDQLPATKAIIFYCRSGVRSIAAGEYALAQGRDNVSHLTGGILAWASAGKPVVSA